MTDEVLNANEIVRLFNRTFLHTYHTELIQGGSEPLYLPAARNRAYHQIVFSHDYVRSALHEISHWCVAGKVRRHLLDYGYWYAPDGRNAAQQADFLKMEVKPQAYEWLLSLCAQIQFEVSLDNLNAPHAVQSQQKLQFTQDVVEYAQTLYKNGLPERLLSMCETLCNFHETTMPNFYELEHYAHSLLNQCCQKEGLRAV
ncbi:MULTISPECIES: elongation factor P hydroxylase [Gammaproteobacteria]|uniref:elongation factor P hydroxylase n=1 Tax=Gammaproteobacteria TaxID=1236 RepID=UPI000DD02484|nr:MULTISPECIES: elongation factor P hydroxylase [Gammaproteobacteria]RTE87390.1 hypothetical protein DQX04_03110 [Aliidiomarina sp. B3213]TCZ92824.1 hypothetical protein EYQ95_02195 [Lysobacter sp. N42]